MAAGLTDSSAAARLKLLCRAAASKLRKAFIEGMRFFISDNHTLSKDLVKLICLGRRELAKNDDEPAVYMSEL